MLFPHLNGFCIDGIHERILYGESAGKQIERVTNHEYIPCFLTVPHDRPVGGKVQGSEAFVLIRMKDHIFGHLPEVADFARREYTLRLIHPKSLHHPLSLCPYLRLVK